MVRLSVAVLALGSACVAGAVEGDRPSFGPLSPSACPVEREYLWPEGRMPYFQPHQVAEKTAVVESQGFDREAHRRPFVDWYEPAASNRTKSCLLVISGGGYETCCDAARLQPVIDRFVRAGVTVANLTYRTPRPIGLPIYQSSWADAQRAVRVIRSQAAKRGYSPDRIGATGISAGAKTVLLLALSSRTPAYERIDALDDLPCNLAFAIPQAPAYVLTDGATGANSNGGEGADIVPELKFDADTAPLCCLQGGIDVYSPLGSLRLFQRLRKMGVPTELHLFADRWHGFHGDANRAARGTGWDHWCERMLDFAALFEPGIARMSSKVGVEPLEVLKNVIGDAGLPSVLVCGKNETALADALPEEWADRRRRGIQSDLHVFARPIDDDVRAGCWKEFANHRDVALPAGDVRLMFASRAIRAEAPVADVRAYSRVGEATLYVNGVPFAKAQPDAAGLVVFARVPFATGVTELRLEAGGLSATTWRRRGDTEGVSRGKFSSVRTAWFEAARFGLFIHWGIYSIPARGEWTYTFDSWKPGEYEALRERFNPVDYDPRQWAKLAKAAGMKYVVFTTRHHDGFCMFDSHFTDYKITRTPYGKDVLRMLVDAFRAEGLRIGFYHSLPDWTHPGYVDLETPVGMKTGKVAKYDPVQHAAFKRLVHGHVNQLTTEYGKIDLMFFDYNSKFKDEVDYFDRQEILRICRKNQPDMMVNDRLSYLKNKGCDFDYYTPEISVPTASPIVDGLERPWETCATMNGNWGYAKDDHDFKSVETLLAGLVGCVSRNGNLLLNVGPDDRGRIPDESVARLKGLADWFGKNGESIEGCGRSELTPPFGCAYTQKGKTLYCHILTLPIGHLILPGLDGKVAALTLLRTGRPVKTDDFWGFETLRPGDLRIAPQGVRAGDVIRIELK